MDLADFAARHSSSVPPLLKELERATWQRTRHGRLMTDPHSGRILSMISRMLRPRIALELGTFTGYGTLCILEGIPIESGGVLHTVEQNDELFALQDTFWQRSKKGHLIKRHHGDALAFLEKWRTAEQGTIDLAYVDADKQNVNAQLDALLPLMSAQGCLLFDNTWWGGTLYDTTVEGAAKGPKANALRELNARLAAEENLHTTVLPVGDGITVVQQR